MLKTTQILYEKVVTKRCTVLRKSIMRKQSPPERWHDTTQINYEKVVERWHSVIQIRYEKIVTEKMAQCYTNTDRYGLTQNILRACLESPSS